MSYIKKRIKKNLEMDPLYREAYDEEVGLLERAAARRRIVMTCLTKLRKARHLTQEQLAERLSISQERVSQIESGAETISVDRLLDIAAALGLRMVMVEEEEVQRRGLDTLVVC